MNIPEKPKSRALLLLVLLMVFTLLPTTAQAADSYTVNMTAGSNRVSDGGTLDLYLDVSNSGADVTSFNAFYATLSYNATFFTFDGDNSTLGSFFVEESSTPGILTISRTGSNISISSGHELTLRFTVNHIVTTGSANFVLSSAKVDAQANAEKQNAPLATISGSPLSVDATASLYRVIIDEDIENGTLRVDKTSAQAGETVVVTITPQAGYQYVDGSLQYTTDGIKYTAVSGTSFIMPAADVTLTVKFTNTSSSINSSVWDGRSIDVSWFDKNSYSSTRSYYISTPAQLAGLAALVNGIYNENIDIFAGDTSAIHANWADSEDSSGSLGNNKSTSAYCYGDFDFNGKTIYLTADIDMGGSSAGNYMPIGGQYLMEKNNAKTKIGASFCGALDGQGHTVSNIYCDRHCSTGNFGDGQSVGLVGRLGVHDNDPISLRPSNAAVRNLAVSGSIYANRSVGGVVGKIGRTNGGVVIENCANFASVSNTDSKGCGGIVGAGWNLGVVRNCYNAGRISSTYDCPTGGISGSNEISLENCYNVGTVSARSDSYAMAIGTNNGGAPISVVNNCWYLQGSASGGGYYSNNTANNDGAMSSADMKLQAFVTTLGSAFILDSNNINNGYPILAWQSHIGNAVGESVTTTTVEVSTSITTNSDGVVVGSADLSQRQMTDIINDALEAAKKANTQGGVEIKTTGDANASQLIITLPSTSVQNIAENKTLAELTISTGVGSLKLDKAALTNLANRADGSTIQIIIRFCSDDEARQAIAGADDPTANTANCVVAEIIVRSGNKDITSFGTGGLTVSIPVDVARFKAGSSYKVIVLYRDGSYGTQYGTCLYRDGALVVQFTVNDLSTFIITGEIISNYADVAVDAWYNQAVSYVSDKGLMTGVGNNLFAPEGDMTRAMLVTTLYRLEGSPAGNSANAFTDVFAGQWYTNAIIWANANGVVQGYGNGRFGTNDDITREQIAAIFLRYANYKGYDTALRSDLVGYTDLSSISYWAMDAMRWANASGLITGRTATMLVPQGTSTRAEVATMLMRFCENIAK